MQESLAIQAKSLDKRFEEIHADKDVSFEVSRGEIFSLLGPNGAGKTTIISMLSCLLKPDQGDAYVMGHSIISDAHGVKSSIGVIPQEIALYEDLSMFLMVVLQLLLLTIFGHLVLDVLYYRDPVSSLLLIVVSALFSASLGLLIGALAKKEEHVIIISLALMFILAGVGGAWVPLEFTPESFQQIAHFTPLAWMVDGFKDIVVRGLGLSAILPALYALMAFAVGLFFLAVWRFRSL